jgi:hypothetical protein
MKRAALTIALVVGTVLPGAAMAQTTGGGGAGGAVGAPLGPTTPGTAAPNPLTPSTATGTPTQRTLTGINQNQQLRGPTTTQPDAVNPGRINGPASETPAGANDTSTGRSTISGTATGRVPDDSNVDTGVFGPGQLSPPTAFELHSGRVPKTP